MKKTYKISTYRGFLSLNRCHIPDDTSFTGFFSLTCPSRKNGIRQDTDKQMNQPGKDVQDIRIIKEETPDKQDKADEKKKSSPG